MGRSCSGSSSWPEKRKKSAMKELVKGREFATQLRGLLHKPFGEDGFRSANELVVKITRSFTQTLSVLSSTESDDVCKIIDQSDSDDRRSEDSDQESSRKRPVSKAKRGCYKRRKNSETWIIVSSAVEDGQAWRKYGQKDILNAKYPRSYFRCTCKYDQGCNATKQVQQVEENPAMYQTTYSGLHTCTVNSLKAPQIITHSGHNPCQSYILNSDTNIPAVASSSSPTIIKQELKEEDAPSDLTDNFSPLDNSFLWSEFKDFESHMGSDHGGDVVSTLDMDFMVKPVGFDTNLHFDESEFF